jgi:hypothetical protein
MIFAHVGAGGKNVTDRTESQGVFNDSRRAKGPHRYDAANLAAN